MFGAGALGFGAVGAAGSAGFGTGAGLGAVDAPGLAGTGTGLRPGKVGNLNGFFALAFFGAGFLRTVSALTISACRLACSMSCSSA